MTVTALLPPADPPQLMVTVQVPVPAGRDAAHLASLLRDAVPGVEVVTSVSVLLSSSPPLPPPPAPAPTPRADLVLMPARRLALLRGEPIAMTRREYDLLLFLARNGERVFTRGQLLRQVWGYTVHSGERTVDVHVRRLRVKLAGAGPQISTVRGIGYRLDALDRLTVIDPLDATPLAA